MKTFRHILACAFFLLAFRAAAAPGAGQKILFIPLDDRPPCLQFTEQIGALANATLVTPPVALLGRFTEPGKSDELAEWVRKQPLETFDAAIISIDMLAYGGLVASRVHQVSGEVALARLHLFSQMRQAAPRLKIYAQSVVMRLAPTPTGANESYRQALADWAHACVRTDEASVRQTARLQEAIPANVMQDYLRSRKRNLDVNLKAIDLVGSKDIDFLILSQDDAATEGIHTRDRDSLTTQIQSRRLSEKIVVQPGADEVSMLLLARAVTDFRKTAPAVYPVFSSAEMADRVMPFEDKPLRETVNFHIQATGARVAGTAGKADILLYVFTSRHERGRAPAFAGEVCTAVEKGRRVIAADIDPIGDVQGGDSTFSETLIGRGILGDLQAYASWNTAGNTLGTALAHGVAFFAAEKKLARKNRLPVALVQAQQAFLLHRILDDYFFHNPVREEANAMAGNSRRSSALLNHEQKKQVVNYSLGRLQTALDRAWKVGFNNGSSRRYSYISCGTPDALSFDLAWNRTFEATIRFSLECKTR